jgi:hypothetical protein
MSVYASRYKRPAEGSCGYAIRCDHSYATPHQHSCAPKLPRGFFTGRKKAPTPCGTCQNLRAL